MYSLYCVHIYTIYSKYCIFIHYISKDYRLCIPQYRTSLVFSHDFERLRAKQIRGQEKNFEKVSVFARYFNIKFQISVVKTRLNACAVRLLACRSRFSSQRKNQIHCDLLWTTWEEVINVKGRIAYFAVQA